MTEIGATRADRSGTSYGRWQPLRQIGAGGMGIVYEAVDTTGRRAALKVISPAYAADPTFRARFKREIEISQKVAGVRTGSVLDADPNGDPPWLASEYIDGPTLGEAIDSSGPLKGDALRAFAVTTAQALAEIHEVGVIHRDLKPTNVILTASTPKVIDFGIAAAAEATSLTGTGMSLGSAGWMSPEQVRGETITTASDVFAWAATVAYAATGRPPFGTGRPEALAYRVVHRSADLDGVPDDLIGPVSRALDPSPDNRPAVSALIAELSGGVDATAVVDGWASVPQTALAPSPVGSGTAVSAAFPPVPASVSDGAQAVGRLRRWGWATAVAIVLVLGAVAFVAWPKEGTLQEEAVNSGATVATASTSTTTEPPATTTSVPAPTLADAGAAWTDLVTSDSVIAAQRSEVIDLADDAFEALTITGNLHGSVIEVWSFDGADWGRTGETIQSEFGADGDADLAPTRDWTDDGTSDVLLTVVGNGYFGVVAHRTSDGWALAEFRFDWGETVEVEGLQSEGRDLISYEQMCDPSCAEGSTDQLTWSWSAGTFVIDRRIEIAAATPQPPMPTPESAAAYLSYEVGGSPEDYTCEPMPDYPTTFDCYTDLGEIFGVYWDDGVWSYEEYH